MPWQLMCVWEERKEKEERPYDRQHQRGGSRKAVKAPLHTDNNSNTDEDDRRRGPWKNILLPETKPVLVIASITRTQPELDQLGKRNDWLNGGANQNHEINFHHQLPHSINIIPPWAHIVFMTVDNIVVVVKWSLLASDVYDDVSELENRTPVHQHWIK